MELIRRTAALPPLDRNPKYLRQVLPEFAPFPRIPSLQLLLAFQTDEIGRPLARRLNQLGPVDDEIVIENDSLVDDKTAARVQAMPTTLRAVARLTGFMEDGCHDLRVAFEESGPRHEAPS